MNEIKWIVFDLGKVVVDIDVDNPIKYLCKLSNIIQQTQVPAAQILFVDDIDVNVTAAQLNGMQDVQFNQADDVRGYLRSIGKSS